MSGTVTPMRAARLAAGLSTNEVGRRVGVSGTMITNLETGRSNPSVGTLYRYAVAVGMTGLAEHLAPVVAALPNEGRTHYGPRRKSGAA